MCDFCFHRRWTKAMEQWRAFNTDVQELTAWLEEAEQKLYNAKNQESPAQAEAVLVVSGFICFIVIYVGRGLSGVMV